MSALTYREFVKRLVFLILIFISPLIAEPAGARDKINVAVAANFICTFQKIASLFEKKAAIRFEAAYSSAGQFYTPIINGAPGSPALYEVGIMSSKT